MTVRKAIVFAPILGAILAAAAPGGAGQRSAGFYDVDREVKIEGPVEDVRLETRFENTQPFFIVKLADKASGRVYTVEIAPAWFFDQDIHRGERLAVVGALSSRGDDSPIVMAREVRFRGETIRVRDRSGFPNGGAGRPSISISGYRSAASRTCSPVPAAISGFCSGFWPRPEGRSSSTRSGSWPPRSRSSFSASSRTGSSPGSVRPNPRRPMSGSSPRPIGISKRPSPKARSGPISTSV